jgi:hypothetical protein
MLLREFVSARSKLSASFALGRVFACQGRPAKGVLSTAVATCQPVSILQNIVGVPEDGQPPETAASKINWSGHLPQTSMIIISREGSFHG